MGKDAGSAPNAPDPKQLIPLQANADKTAFNYQTDANRFNTIGPDQSQTWNKTSVFDDAAYQKALGDWSSSAKNGVWVPGTPAGEGGFDTDHNPIPGAAATEGHWEGAAGPTGERPMQGDFTTNKYSLTTQLAPGAQALHDAQQGTDTTKNQIAQALLGQLKGTLGSQFDTSSAPKLASDLHLKTDPGISGMLDKLGGLDPTQFSNRASDAAYSAATRYLDPQVQQQQQALEARLSEQGFVPGTPGYQQAMQNFMDTNNRAYGAARDSSVLQGFNVGHTQFGDASSNINSQIAAALQGAGFSNDATLKDASFQNSARGQGIAELLQQRQVPLSDLNSILGSLGGGGFNPTNAGSAAVPQGGVGALQNPDQMSAYNEQYKNLLNQYNAGVASDNNTTSTVGSLVGAIAIAF